MLRKIVSLSLQFRYLVLLCAAALILIGGLQLRTKPVDLLPEFGPLEVEVQTEALGLAAAEVEALLTNPLEEILTGVPWLDDMRSNSITGLSSVVLTFKPGTDMMNARQMVQERLLQASVLPKVSKPPTMLQPVSSLNRAMQVGLSSDTQSLIDLSILARWKIKPRLMSVPGVANVSIWGQRERQLQVQVDPEKLKEKGVQLNDVIRAAGDALWVSPLTFLRASTPGTGGFIDTPTQRYDIRHVLPISSPEHLASISFPAADGSTLRLSDVATVVEGHQPMIGDGIVKDAPGLLLMVEKFPGANTQEVTKGIERALVALKPGLPGVNITSDVFRPASFIETSLSNLASALIVGGILAVAALVLMLRDWRAGLISLVVIPLSLLAAWTALVLFGMTINAIILAGLVAALVAVVDDAIVDVDNTRRRLREAQGAEPASATVFMAAIEVRRPVLHATVIVALATLPILFVQGAAGALLQPLFVSCLVALLASMIVAQTVTPALSILLLPTTTATATREPPLQGLQNHYQRLLARAVASPRRTLMAVGLFMLLGLLALPLLRTSLLPVFMDRDLLVSWTAAPGTSYPEMSRMLSEASKKVRDVAGVRNVGAHLGRAVQSDTVAGVNAAEVWVSLAPEADYEKTVAAVRQALDSYPGTRSEPISFASRKVQDAMSNRGEAVVVQIYGPAWNVLQDKAEEVRQALSSVQGLANPRVLTRAQEPGVEVEVNLAAAERHGIKPGDVRRAAATLMAGIEVGSLYEGQKIFEVVVWGAPELRRDPNLLRDLSIDSPKGEKIRLGDVADVRLTSSSASITRDSASRYVDVIADVRDRDIPAVLTDVGQKLQSIKFPLEYHPEVIGEYGARQANEAWVISFGVAAAVGMFLLLQASLRSWRLAGLVYLLLPVSLTGGLLAAVITGGVFSIGSAAGLLMVLLITARSAVLLAHHYQRLEQDEQEASRPDLALRGVRERFLPVATTTVVTTVGLLPLVVSGGAPGLEIVHPMAVVMVGGLITSTLLVLFALPALYSALRTRNEPEALPEPEYEADRRVHHAAE
jgi:CzcA family heavy metal efflux pump